MREPPKTMEALVKDTAELLIATLTVARRDEYLEITELYLKEFHTKAKALEVQDAGEQRPNG